MLKYHYKAYEASSKEQLVEMAINGSCGVSVEWLPTTPGAGFGFISAYEFLVGVECISFPMGLYH